MLNRWAGPLITGLIVVGVALILLLNLNPRRPSRHGNERDDKGSTPVNPVAKGSVIEYPIGVPVLKNHMQIVAVWLPSVQWDGPNLVTGTDVIHLEADVKATEQNPNGFAKNEFVPYLKIDYKIEPLDGGSPLVGPLTPMVASDGLHYGASVALSKPGNYRLTFAVQPPSANGLGRHHDPLTGVAPWWEPFESSFEWEYQPPAALAAGANRP